MRIDADVIGNAEAQYFYVYGNLDSKIQAMVLLKLYQAERDEMWDYESILMDLERMFDDPNKKDSAASRLYNLKQGGDSLLVFLSKFERLLHEADANRWSDDSKITILRHAVNEKLQNKLDVQLELPRTYDKFVKALQKLGGHGGGPVLNVGFRGSSEMYSGTTAPTHSLVLSKPMDLSVLKESEFGSGSGSEQLRTIRFARNSTPLERNLWQQTGCYRHCGAPDHWVADCPMAPASNVLS
jgi:Retrotransposon gag protein